MNFTHSSASQFQYQGAYNDASIRIHYDVDIVLCIDGTGSMSPVIDLVKKNSLNLPNDIIRVAADKDKVIDNLRIRIIVFRDYLSDGKYCMQESDFFALPEEKKDLHDTIAGIIASGGGDEPEDALEALAYAMASDWQPTRQGARRRQIISVWTDASAHKLGFGNSSAYYDKDFLPNDFEELTDWWGDENNELRRMDDISKRLALFAPSVEPWTILARCWNNVFLVPTDAGKGMHEKNYEDLVNMLVHTI